MIKQTEGPGKAYEHVVNYIQGLIFSGALKRGEKLVPERELAEQLGVGRNSVREAMRTLSLMGFISSTQGAGNYVTCDLTKNLTASIRMMLLLGETSYRQISELRTGIEAQAALLAARHITLEQAAELERIGIALASETNSINSAVLDRQIHHLLSESADNWLIHTLLHALSDVIDSFILNMHVKIMSDPALGRRLQYTHQGIITAVLEHDGDEAAHMMREHFKVVDRAIDQL